MANILFQNNQNPQNGGNSVLNMVSNLRAFGPSETLYQQFYNSNPRFRAFADSVRNIGPEQAFRQNGLDFNQFRGYRW